MTSIKAPAASITSVTLEVPDPAAGAFYRAAFGFTDPDGFAWEATPREHEAADVVEGRHHG